MFSGLLDLPWWGYVLTALALTHITIASVTIYLHRHQAHRALELHPVASHFFRFWLWLTTGTVTKEWASIHRKHHAKCETADDPHSPQILGIKKVLLEGAELYRKEAKNQETLEKYGRGTPDDWLERNLYSKHSMLGIMLMLVIDVLLFGPIGITVWAVQMIWIPVTAAGIINGAGHYWGYRNFQPADASTNIVPWGILIGGEELHNNHHAYIGSAKLSSKWYEFDIGWLYIRSLAALGLAKVKRVAPKVHLNTAKTVCDIDTLHAVMANRYEVMAKYAKSLKENLSRRNRTAQTAHARLWENRPQASQTLAACRCDRSERAGKIKIGLGHTDQPKIEYGLHAAPRSHRDLAALHGDQGADGKRPGRLVPSRRNQRH